MSPSPDPEILRYYAAGLEDERLTQGPFQLERVRTEELLKRHLPSPPAKVLDVGGGSGPYACRLAGQGYEVTLLDPVPLHVEQARRAGESLPKGAVLRAGTDADPAFAAIVEGRRRRLLAIARAVERETWLLAVSPHIMAVGQRP
jgi:SAM-dependent methyltransferase